MSFLVNPELMFSIREAYHDRYIFFAGFDVQLILPGTVSKNTYGDATTSGDTPETVKMYIDEAASKLLGDFQKYFEDALPITARFQSHIKIVEHSIVIAKLYDRLKKESRENKFEVTRVSTEDKLFDHIGSVREVTLAPYRG